MPTYDYECTECGNIFEYFQNMSDPPLTDCPKCGKGVKRLIGGGMGVIFKGSGFYVTDNKKASSSYSSVGSSKNSEKKTASKTSTETASS